MKDLDIVIIGGGLAGLTAAIHLGRKNLKVCIIEKENYPHHKVCGEYLSNEIIPYLNTLDINLLQMHPAPINSLQFTTVNGKSVQTKLKMGGMGISRFALDNFLFEHAKINSEIIQATVTDVKFQDDQFITEYTNGKIKSKFVLGAFGKRSLIDKKLAREFIQKSSGWLGIKGHYENSEYQNNLVSLHNFSGGYCGLSKTETGAVNACYLATYSSFKNYKDPEKYKKEVLFTNPFLKRFFESSTPVFDKDISIAQISFEDKSRVEDHILMLGDAACLIHPLCGNGMAMAIHSAKLASEAVLKYFQENVSREQIELSYCNSWNKNFSSRIKNGQKLQHILMNDKLAGFSQNIIQKIPFLLPHIIKRTHGNLVT